MSGVDIYPVGLLRDLAYFVHCPDRAEARSRLRYDLRYPWERLKRREWRPLKSYFNGYLAEPRELPEGLNRIGSGWTRGRAWRDLQRRIAEIEPTPAVVGAETTGARSVQ